MSTVALLALLGEKQAESPSRKAAREGGGEGSREGGGGELILNVKDL
jgi:hypothetical protein